MFAWELIAWIIGWDLILEHLFGAATVAVGWSGYVVSFLRDVGVSIPPQWYNAPGLELVQVPGSDTWVQVTSLLGEQLLAQGITVASLPHATGVFNIVAAVAIALVSMLLVLGIKESARFNNLAVVIKVSPTAATTACSSGRGGVRRRCHLFSGEVRRRCDLRAHCVARFGSVLWRACYGCGATTRNREDSQKGTTCSQKGLKWGERMPGISPQLVVA